MTELECFFYIYIYTQVSIICRVSCILFNNVTIPVFNETKYLGGIKRGKRLARDPPPEKQ